MTYLQRTDIPDVRFWFLGAELWDGRGAFPDRVPVQRIPVTGEFVTLPDEPGRWEVISVEHDYSEGLAFPPIVGVVCCRPSETQERQKSVVRK